MSEPRSIKDEVKDVIVVFGFSLAVIGLAYGAFHLLKLLFA